MTVLFSEIKSEVQSELQSKDNQHVIIHMSPTQHVNYPKMTVHNIVVDKEHYAAGLVQLSTRTVKVATLHINNGTWVGYAY